MDECVMIKKCADGDPAAFTFLVEQYQNRVYAIAFNMLHSEADSMDACQEVFLKIYKGIGKFKGGSSLSTWIYRITTNVCLDFLRKSKKENTISIYKDDEQEIQLAAEHSNPEELYIGQEQRKALRSAISQLPADFRAAIVLRDIHGFSYDEIAGILSVSLGAVKSRIFRARQVLRETLKKNGNFL